MKVEISKEQKEALSKKIALCVDFLKLEVQPHMVNSDLITISMGEVMELCVTSKEVYIINLKPINIGIELCYKRKLSLDKHGSKKAKKYICDVCPELAVEFLRNWEKVRDKLMSEVIEKEKKVKDLNSFVDSFQL